MTAEELFTSLETEYAARLEKRAQQWQLKYPAEAKALRESIDAHFEREPLPGGLLWLAREAAVVEAIRQKKGWPSMREFVRLQGGEEPAPPIVPLKLIPKAVPPPVERFDAKAKASGE